MSEPSEPLSDKWLAKVEKFPCRGDVPPLLAEVRRLRANESRAVEAARAEQREADAKIAEDYAGNEWARYKGRPPFEKNCEGRASDIVQGKSIAGEDIAAAIRSAGSPACGPPPAGGKIGMESD